MPPNLEDPQGAYDAFVRARTPSLLRSAYLLTGDQHLAEDLVQAALARTHRSWGRLRETGNAEAYTRKVMYHLQVAWWRRRRVTETLAAAVPERSAPGQRLDDQVAERATLRQALLRLTTRQRAVLVARYFDDRSEEETAGLLGVSVGTVKSQTARALQRLRTVAPARSGRIVGSWRGLCWSTSIAMTPAAALLPTSWRFWHRTWIWAERCPSSWSMTRACYIRAR